jgi:hypothetical protein
VILASIADQMHMEEQAQRQKEILAQRDREMSTQERLHSQQLAEAAKSRDLQHADSMSLRELQKEIQLKAEEAQSAQAKLATDRFNEGMGYRKWDQLAEGNPTLRAKLKAAANKDGQVSQAAYEFIAQQDRLDKAANEDRQVRAEAKKAWEAENEKAKTLNTQDMMFNKMIADAQLFQAPLKSEEIPEPGILPAAWTATKYLNPVNLAGIALTQNKQQRAVTFEAISREMQGSAAVPTPNTQLNVERVKKHFSKIVNDLSSNDGYLARRMNAGLPASDALVSGISSITNYARAYMDLPGIKDDAEAQAILRKAIGLGAVMDTYMLSGQVKNAYDMAKIQANVAGRIQVKATPQGE